MKSERIPLHFKIDNATAARIDRLVPVAAQVSGVRGSKINLFLLALTAFEEKHNAGPRKSARSKK